MRALAARMYRKYRVLMWGESGDICAGFCVCVFFFLSCNVFFFRPDFELVDGKNRGSLLWSGECWGLIDRIF